MGSVGVLPERTPVAARARLLVDINGACIYETGVGGSPATLMDDVGAVLGSSLRAARRPVKVRAGGAPAGPHFDWTTISVYIDSTRRQQAHMDGFGRYGEAYPDYAFLLCERPAGRGGESYVIDCLKLLDLLRDDPGSRDLTEFLWTQPMEQCSPEGVSWRAPAARVTPGGRRAVLYNDKQHLPGSTTFQEHQLEAWRRRVAAAEDAATRFLLRPGDLLCLDNYRVAHGREPYHGTDRLLHRVWTWTEAAFGILDPDAADLEGEARDKQRGLQPSATTLGFASQASGSA